MENSSSIFLSFVSSKLFLLALLFGLLRLVWTVLYRLFWSPIASFPGPKLAAATFLYEFYYDVILQGEYTFQIGRLHEKYGPIVRINPEEIHIDDVRYYDEVFVGSSTRKTDKWPRTAVKSGTRWSLFNTISHDLHRRRRAMIAPHFSSQSIHRLGPVIRGKVAKLMQRLDQAASTSQPISLSHAYAALTTDIITAYCFAESYNCLDDEAFAPQFYEVAYRNFRTAHMMVNIPWIVPLVKSLPEWLVNYCLPDQATIAVLQKRFTNHVKQVQQKRARSIVLGNEQRGSSNADENYSMIHTMLDADVPESEKRVERLAEEAQIIVLAGFVTTAHVLEIITYHLLAQPLLLSRLKDEISDRFSPSTDLTSVPQSTFESLPYLTAVIYEGLRLAYGVVHRIQRISPETLLKYKNQEIPAGTPVSMSAYFMHGNSEVFRDPMTFRPERWLPLDTVGQPLLKFLVAFSKGSRQCLGMNLAWAELYCTVPALFGGNRELHLYDVVFERDIEMKKDGVLPLPSRDSKGLRATISFKQT